MSDNKNIGYAFPLEKLGSDIARNNYNYQSILNGLIEWNSTSDDTVNIRLTKDTDPWFEDYQIPSKKTVLDTGTLNTTITSEVGINKFVPTGISSALYGGSKKFTISTADTSTDIDIAVNTITLIDATGFELDDQVKIQVDSGGSLPDPLVDTQLYYIVSKNINDIQLSLTSGGVAIDITTIGNGILTFTKYTTSYIVDKTDPGDIATIRATVNNVGDGIWRLYYSIAIQDWDSGTSYKAPNIVKYSGLYYKVVFDVESSIISPDIDTLNFTPLFKSWSSSIAEEYNIGDYAIDDVDGGLYIASQYTAASNVRPSESSIFTLVAPLYVANMSYESGSYVFNSNNLFMSTTNVINSTIAPSVETTGLWAELLVDVIPTVGTFTSTSVFRWTATINTSNFFIRNESFISSNANTNINLRLTVKGTEPASIYQRSVDIFPTSNFSFWPQSDNSIWDTTTTYGPTDDSIPITKRQNYSATMVFDHTRPDIAKTVNYINYDGPDLDQGLCIYLPVEIDIGDDGLAYPEDGFTFEFFFRLWPSVALNDATTRDHIINKSHIYVYSAANNESITTDTCEEPVAKFSMARSTNFYMFGENVTVPDKPVCYRATFVYSEADKKWCTLDYYQLPDHIFVGPVGFIDPQNPANMDINNEAIGNINPNAANIGYETAAFPMFQDPFSNGDLTPYRVSGDDVNGFKNRIV
jgi:hypothetical protein